MKHHKMNNEDLFFYLAMPVFLLDKNGCILQANPAAIKYLGYQTEDLHDKAMTAFLRYPGRDYFNKALQYALKGNPQELQVRLSIHNKDTSKGLLSLHPIFSGREAAYVYAVWQALPEGQNSVSPTDYLHELYRKFIESLPIMVHQFDEDGYILEANPWLLQKLDFKRDDVVGKQIGDFLHAESKRAMEKWIFPSLLEKGSIQHVSQQLQPRQGNTMDVLVSALQNDERIAGKRTFTGIIYDVTANKAVARQLQESEERFRAIFKQDPAVKLLIDAETGRLEDCNQAALDFYGYSMNEMLQLKITEVNQLPEKEAFASMQKAGSKKANTFYFKHKLANGEIRHVEVYSTPITFGGKQKLFSIVHDITARINAEKALKESEQRFRHIISNSADAIFITDQQGNYTYVNFMASRLLGYSREKLLESNIRDFWPAGQDYQSHYMGLFKRLLEQGRIFTEIELQKSDGAVVPVDLNAVVLPDGRVHASLRDISARKKAEHELITAKEQAEDAEQRLKKSNEELRATEEELRASNDELYDINAELERKNKALENTEKALKIKNEELRAAEEELIVSNDELKRQNQELEEARKKAEESDKLKTSFLANMSHEIRTPLNGIIGFADLLHKHDLPQEQKQKYLDVIMRSARRMFVMINDLIDIAKIESGQIALHLASVKLNDLLQELQRIFKQEAQKKGLELEMEANPDLCDTFVNTDKEKLYAILSNLLKNAIKYTDEGRVTFGCQLHANKMSFFVQDTGPGIAPGRREAIFDRFVQGDLHYPQAKDGAGLGLSISKAYVELMGGQIYFETQLAAGAVFYVDLPFA